MIAALAAALEGKATLVVANNAAAIATLRQAVAHDVSGMVLLVLPANVAVLDRAMLIAAIGPLALEAAPAVRIGALDLAEGAAADDVVAAAQFLAAARSTTGQVLRLTPADA